jgi:thioredoxin 1
LAKNIISVKNRFFTYNGVFMAENIIELSDNNFKDQISNGITLVDFHASWCGPCRMIAPIVEQLAGMVKGKAKIAKVDIDQAQDVTNTLQITSVPTLILFKDGKEVKRVVGVKDLDYLLNLVQSA